MQDHTTRPAAPKFCECGCGKPITGGYRFLQGHNSKAPDLTPEQRFWKHVEVGPFTDCWLWQGAKRNGYGVLNVDYKVTYAHRFSYELHHGPIPEGQEVCHSCDRRSCANPYHLFAGTHADNINDMYNKGRGAGGAHKGEKHTKLTEDQVRQIRQLAADGILYPAIAKRFGVSVPAISLIVTRKRWKHI